MTEQEVVDDYKQRLEPWFICHQEVKGKSIISGMNKRIDMVIVSKEIPIGMIKPMAFGVEFKADQMESMGDYTAWLKQAIGYTQCEWGVHKQRLPILVAPFIDRSYCDNEGKVQSEILSRLAGQFGIGELGIIKYDRDYGYGLESIKIKMCGSSMWCSISGWNASLVKMDFKKRYTI